MDIKSVIVESLLTEWLQLKYVPKVTIHHELHSNGGKGKVKPKAPDKVEIKREKNETDRSFADRIESEILKVHDKFTHESKARGLVCSGNTYCEVKPLLNKNKTGKHEHTRSLATAKTEKGMKKAIRKDELLTSVEIHKA